MQRGGPGVKRERKWEICRMAMVASKTVQILATLEIVQHGPRSNRRTEDCSSVSADPVSTFRSAKLQIACPADSSDGLLDCTSS